MKHVVSLSGGKDSTATYLKAIERGLPFEAVFADTGNEHPATYEAVALLPSRTGGPPIRTVRADFTERVLARRAFVRDEWPALLQAGRPGKWEWREDRAGQADRRAALRAWIDAGRIGSKPNVSDPGPPPAMPDDPFASGLVAVWRGNGRWVWRPGLAPMSLDRAMEVVEAGLAALIPTGNAYLDLCLWKGVFPSRRAQFCTEHLKVLPINTQVVVPLLGSGETVVSWQGVRAAESLERSYLRPLQQVNAPPGFEHLPGRILAYRPLLTWKIEDVWAIAARHGVPANPLYGLGCSRVGCFPCVNSTKTELSIAARLFPDVIARLDVWERRVSAVSRRGMATFFSITKDPIMLEAWGLSELMGTTVAMNLDDHGVRAMARWALSDRGGRQMPLFPIESAVCSTHGMCE